MNPDLAQTAIGMKLGAIQHNAQIAMLKKSHEMQMSMIAMLDDAVKSVPPAPQGMGLSVDKSA